MLLVAFIVIVILIIMLTHFINTSINNRLYLLNDSMKQVEQGQLVAIEEDMGKDEIATTVHFYNTMVNKTYDLVYKDPLSGLANRSSITNHIETLYGDETCKNFGVLFLDIDDFRVVNDVYGHEVGDRVIVKISNRLKRLMTDQIEVARFGGDEFIIVIQDCGSITSLESFAQAVKSEIVKTVMIGELHFNLNASIGVVHYPEHGISGSDLIKKADMALNKSKLSGKNKVSLYEVSLMAELEDTMEFQKAILEAFENNEFYLNYQPLYHAKSQKILGIEALIRWHSETYGQVSPFKLIRNAEEMGLIIDLGEWILKEACQFIYDINETHDHPIKVSINISMIQLFNIGFAKQIKSIVDDIGLSPEYVILEMTETIMIESLQRGISIIEELVDLGFGIAIDDFGTGYSSLSYLKHLPVTELKIDRAFVNGIVKNSFDKKLINAIVSVAHEKGMHVVAEGVEYENQYDILLEEEVDIIQGYYFSKPVSEDEIRKMI